MTESLSGPHGARAGWSVPDVPGGQVQPGQVPAGLGVPPPPPQRITLPPGFRPPVSPAAFRPPGMPVPGQPPGPPGQGWPVPAGFRQPSGLFPSGPPRPTYREPNPARLGEVALGGAAATLWMALFGLLAGTARAYAWWTVASGAVAWLAAFILARWGMRGIAAGVALTTGLAVAIGGVIVVEHWLGGHWLLW